MTPPVRFRFAEFVLSPRQRLQLRNGTAVALIPNYLDLFLVLFSYAFFFEGFTGLAITVGAILTLFVLMQMTAHVSWDETFRAGSMSRPSENGNASRG